MALAPQGTKVSLPVSKVPSDFVAPAVTTFTDAEYTRSMTLSIDKTTVDEADPATTLLAIIQNATIGIDKQISDIMGADFDDTALTITYYIDFTGLSTNMTPETAAASLLTNAATVYQAGVNVYIKTA